jgi:methyl-accepting chemotaxis protein
MKIRVKLLLSVVFITAIAYVISIGYTVSKLKSKSLRDAFEIADLNARESAEQIRGYLNYDMDASRSMVQIFRDFRNIPQKQRVDFFKRTIHALAQENPQFISVWGSWEINAIDSTYKKPYGRFRYTYYWENEILKYKEETLDTEGDNISGGYYKVKVSKIETMIDPYWFSYTNESAPILEASTAVPLIENGEFRGLFGLDIELTRYQGLVSEIQPFEGSYAMMLSHNGTIVAHRNEEFLGKSFQEQYASLDKIFGISQKVNIGENFSFILVDSISNLEYYASFAAIPIGKTNNPWSVGLIVPLKTLKLEADTTTQNAIALAIIGLLILSIIIWFIAYRITIPLVKAKQVLGELAQGNIDRNRTIAVDTGDEIEEIGNSINTLIDGLSKTATFAQEIGKGNLDATYHKLSEGDVLGASLVEMRKSLLIAKQLEEERRLEDERISWATLGIAKFAELLRLNNDNLTEFSNVITSNIVKYTNANIGALFLLNDENPSDKHVELAATFAYNRRKYYTKRIELNEGLVGRCVLEKETIFLTEIPKNYIQIGSGLGEEIPSCLLLVPLKLNEQVFGVIELAAFEPFERYVIEFVEKIGESIAATVSSVKISIKTVKLLEESKIKSEELASQEEEMRQNMEELQATQEEAARKTAEMESLINALNTSSYVIEYDTSGKVINVNDAYLTLTNQSAEQIIGSHHADNMLMDEVQLKEYSLFWEDLRSGKIRKETTKVSIGNKVYTFIETYSPIYNESQRVIKVIKIAHNITDFIGDGIDFSKKKS